MTTKNTLTHITGRSKDVTHFSQKYIWGGIKQCLQGCLPFHLILFLRPLFFFPMDSKIAASSPELIAPSYKEEKISVSSSSNYVPRRMGVCWGNGMLTATILNSPLIWSL